VGSERRKDSGRITRKQTKITNLKKFVYISSSQKYRITRGINNAIEERVDKALKIFYS
jgi:hypothetical protein